MPRERWAEIPTLPGYRASTLGRVRSVDRFLSDGRFCGGEMLTAKPDDDGYLYVTIFQRRRHVARLVLLAFRGLPRRNDLDAKHKNGIREDCRLSNLEWGTKSSNAKDRERHRRIRQKLSLLKRLGQL